MIDEEVRSLLKFPIINAGKTGPIMEKRLKNIEFIRNINRDRLENGTKERRLLIKETEKGESIYIQYPGKETRPQRTYPKPWDFRPKIFFKENDESHKDMTFQDIWDIIVDISKDLSPDDKVEVLEILGVLFYRMGHMLDHKMVKGYKTKSIDITIDMNKKESATFESLETMPEYYQYDPDKRVIDYLSNNYDISWDAMSLECFLIYNELLTWNEDCKYYYIKCVYNDDDWSNEAGRINTTLTHMNIISFLLGRQNISRLCMGFSRPPSGVSGLTKKEIMEYFKDFLVDDERLFKY
jgi:hypothetical protein